MKYIFTLIAITFFYIAIGQKIETSEIDKFTKQKRVTTSKEKLFAKPNDAMHIYLRSVDSFYFVTVYGFGKGADVIGEHEKMLFLLDNDETVTAYSTGLQTYDIRRYDKSYSHQYSITKEDLQTLSEHKLKSIRKYGTKYYNDLEIPERNSDVVMKLSSLILKETK